MGLIVVIVVLIIGIGALVQSQRMSQKVSTPKMVMSIALALIIATGPYIALVLIPTNSNIVVTEITMDEEADTISFVVRGSFNSVSTEIVHNGEVLWSESGDTKSEKVTFIVPISDIFVTNAMDYGGPNDGILEEYIINAESSEGQKSSATINPSYLTREVKDAAVKINQIDKPNQDGIVEVVGLQVEIVWAYSIHRIRTVQVDSMMQYMRIQFLLITLWMLESINLHRIHYGSMTRKSR